MRVKMFLISWFFPFAVAAQLHEFQQVKRLSSAINTAGEEGMPLLSPDGNLYFTRALYAGNSGGRFSGVDAWFSAHRSGSWMNASNALPGRINDEGHTAIVGISQDGRQLHFIRVKAGRQMNGLYVTSRLGNHWSSPEIIFIPGIENRDFLGVHVSADGQVVLFSMNAPDSRGEEDIYFSTKSANGVWSVPRSLGPTINTNGYEISPFLSLDKKRLYFSSNGHGGEGSADIFYSERLYDSWETWSAPVNLGKEVNSAKFDAYFSVYGDSVAYLASNRESQYADIYELRIVHRQTVLAAGQQYLSETEWRRALGGAVSNELVFAPDRVTLTGAQQELLFYIANRLQLQRSVLFHLIVPEQERAEATAQRLKVVQDYLVQSGIDEGRIIVRQVAPPENASGGKIVIRLIE